MHNNENSIQTTDLSAARMQYILGEVFLTYAYKRMKEGSICDDPDQPFTDDWIITYRALSEAIAAKEEITGGYYRKSPSGQFHATAIRVRRRSRGKTYYIYNK